jgi:3-hydroxyisobutyrate dehydrogenase
MASVGVIGLGPMGMGVARCLLRAGFTVHAFDPRPPAVQAFIDAGGKAATSPASVAAAVDIVVLVLANVEQVELVLFGPDGAAAALPGGAVAIVGAAVPPDYPETVSRRLAERGLLMLDAPMSGGGLGSDRLLSVMASGPAAAFDKATEVLDAIAENVYRLGEQPGQGSRVKMINQLLAGVHIAAAAEAVALGIRIGCDPHALYAAISHSAGNSVMFENRVPHILAGDYTASFPVDVMVKDLGIVLDLARRSDFPAPLTAAAHRQFVAASVAGYGAAEDIAVIKLFPS